MHILCQAPKGGTNMHRYATANMAGAYHVKNNIVCQDSFYVKKLNDNITIAAVADGLGSEKYSDIGSKIASRVAVEHCIKNYNSNLNEDEVKKLMNNAFVYGYKSILEEAEAAGEDEDEYDTTLSLVIFDDTKLYFGQSGDSGIVVLLDTGEYIKLSDEQNDEYGNVYPLCSGPDVWQFGKAKGNVASVMLMTDGVLKRICPKILKYDDRNINVNVPFAESFMRRNESSDEAVDLFQTSLREFLENYPEEKIDDDKTVVLIYSDTIDAARMDETYYKAPNWDKLHKLSLNNLNRSDNDNPKSSESPEISDPLTDPPSTLTNESENGETTNVDSTDLNEDDDIPHSSVEKEEADKITSAKKNSHRKNPKHTKPQYHNNSLVFDLIVLLIIFAFSLIAFFSSEWLSNHASTSYMTVILLCFLSNATVLLPAPSAIVVVEFSFILNPIIVALCGGLGSALGEMLGYAAGFHGVRAIQANLNHSSKNNKLKTFIKKHKSKHPYILTFLTSIIPLPIFDIIGIAAGASKLNPFKFFTATICGKILKFLMYTFIAYQLIPIISSMNL